MTTSICFFVPPKCHPSALGKWYSYRPVENKYGSLAGFPFGELKTIHLLHFLCRWLTIQLGILVEDSAPAFRCSGDQMQ